MFPSPTELLPAFFFCVLATANLAKMNVWDLELSKLQKMQKQGSACIAWISFTVVSIAKRCQCHQPASTRDQGINFQGKRYPFSVRSVCRREQRQYEEISTMQCAVLFLCLMVFSLGQYAHAAARSVNASLAGMVLKNCLIQIQCFQQRAHGKIIISV